MIKKQTYVNDFYDIYRVIVTNFVQKALLCLGIYRKVVTLVSLGSLKVFF